MTSIKCSGCGREASFPGPLSVCASFTCSACAPSDKKNRLRRRRNDGKNEMLVVRLEQFVDKPLSGHEDEWFELSKELRLDAVTLESLVEVVQEQRWRTSTAPIMYVRTNVLRRSKEWEDPFGEDGRLRIAQIFGEFTNEDREFSRFWIKISSEMKAVNPSDLEKLQQSLSVIKDDWERLAICARALGVTREDFMSAGSIEIRHKKAAAWKRLDRNGPPEDLRRALRAALARKRASFEIDDDDFYEVRRPWEIDRDLLDTCALTRSFKKDDEF